MEKVPKKEEPKKKGRPTSTLPNGIPWGNYTKIRDLIRRRGLTNFLDEVDISTASWEKIKQNKRKLKLEDSARLVKSLEMSNVEWQQLLVSVGCREWLEWKLPVAKVKWAFKFLRDDPENDGVIPEGIKEGLSLPLAIQGYIVLLYQELTGLTLLRPLEGDAVEGWLNERFGLSDAGLGAMPEASEPFCKRVFWGGEFAKASQVQRLLVEFSQMQGLPWTPDDSWIMEPFLVPFDPNGCEEEGPEEALREEFLRRREEGDDM